MEQKPIRINDDDLSDAIAEVLNRYKHHISSSQILDEMHGALFAAVKTEILVSIKNAQN